jgi:hypothetical protein
MPAGKDGIEQRRKNLKYLFLRIKVPNANTGFISGSSLNYWVYAGYLLVGSSQNGFKRLVV